MENFLWDALSFLLKYTLLILAYAVIFIGLLNLISWLLLDVLISNMLRQFKGWHLLVVFVYDRAKKKRKR